MKIVLTFFLILCAAVTGLQGQDETDAEQLKHLLHIFLEGASRNDVEIHNRFWADELIYTGSTGRRVGKSDIMNDLRSMPADQTGEPVTTYTAEDIRILQYDDTAVVAFRLIAVTEMDNGIETANYFNTGTFVKQNGIWQAVAWQATKIP